MTRILVVFLLFVAIPAQPQNNIEYESVLVPIATKVPVRGAFGSEWDTEFTVRNESDEEVRLWAGVDPFGLPFAIATLQPRTTRMLRLFATGGRADQPDPVPAYILVVAKLALPYLAFQARAFDRSRDSLNWGTEVPIIRENEAARGNLHLLNIPTDARFRITLRFYVLSSFLHGLDLKTRVFDQESGALLGERTVHASGFNANSEGPHYWQSSDLASEFGIDLSNVPRIRIEVERTNAQQLFWTMANVTNNETQHFTTITPQ